MTAVDLFSGLGGFSEGARMAGVRVLWAANHWRAALDVHAVNHPDATHVCQDLQQANWLEVPKHDALLSSPACQGHSRARGRDRAHHDAARSTAWAVVSCAEVHRPSVLVVENVPEFLKWSLFPAWEMALQALGYSLSPHVLDAADHGVPQHRRRVFIIGTRSRSKFCLREVRREHVPVASILDEGGRFRATRSLCVNSRRRITAGRRQHGSRFLIAYYGNERGGRSVDRPLGTVTTRDRYALVNGSGSRMLSVGEYRRAMGFPDNFRLPDSSTLSKHLLGNAVVPVVAADLLADLQLHL